MSEERPTVFVVDDDPSMRKALKSLLRSVGLDVETFTTAREFLAARRSDGHGCLVLDVRIPGMSGLDLQCRLAEAKSHIPIIFISGHGDIPMSVRAMKAGAVDFLAKPFRDQDLLDAVHRALERDRQARLQRLGLAELCERLETLTLRELEVMDGVVRGRLNKQIASALGLTEVTVKLHRHRLMKKMRADSLAELIRMAYRLGLPPGKARDYTKV